MTDSIQGAHIVDAEVADAVARYLTLLRGAEAAGLTAASFRFFTPDMMVPVWQVLHSLWVMQTVWGRDLMTTQFLAFS